MIYERMCELTQTEPIWLAAKEHRKYPSPVVALKCQKSLIKNGFVIDPTRKIDGDVGGCRDKGRENCR